MLWPAFLVSQVRAVHATQHAAPAPRIRMTLSAFSPSSPLPSALSSCPPPSPDHTGASCPRDPAPAIWFTKIPSPSVVPCCPLPQSPEARVAWTTPPTATWSTLHVPPCPLPQSHRCEPLAQSSTCKSALQFFLCLSFLRPLPALQVRAVLATQRPQYGYHDSPLPPALSALLFSSILAFP